MIGRGTTENVNLQIANFETPMTGQGTTETVNLNIANFETPMTERGTTEIVNLKIADFETSMASTCSHDGLCRDGSEAFSLLSAFWVAMGFVTQR